MKCGTIAASGIIFVLSVCDELGLVHSHCLDQPLIEAGAAFMDSNVIMRYGDIRCGAFHSDKMAMRVNCVMFLRLPCQPIYTSCI